MVMAGTMTWRTDGTKIGIVVIAYSVAMVCIGVAMGWGIWH